MGVSPLEEEQAVMTSNPQLRFQAQNWRQTSDRRLMLQESEQGGADKVLLTHPVPLSITSPGVWTGYLLCVIGHLLRGDHNGTCHLPPA